MKASDCVDLMGVVINDIFHFTITPDNEKRQLVVKTGVSKTVFLLEDILKYRCSAKDFFEYTKQELIKSVKENQQ